MTADAAAPVIRPLAAHEWRELRAVRLRSLEDSPDAFGFTVAAAIKQPDAYWEQWAGKADDPRRRTFVVDVDGVLEGVGLARLLDDRSGHLAAMWLAPRLRGTGTGAMLFDAACAFLLALEPVRLALDVTETNHSAIALYRSRGFVFTGESEPLRDGSPLRSLRMVRPLSSGVH